MNDSIIVCSQPFLEFSLEPFGYCHVISFLHPSDENIDVELVEEEPPFLRGRTKHTMNLSPVKIVKVCCHCPHLSVHPSDNSNLHAALSK